MISLSNVGAFLLQSANDAAVGAQTVASDAGEAAQKGIFGKNSILIFMLPVLLLLMFGMGGGNRRKQKEMQAMLKNLEKGDKVQSIGGVIGSVAHVKENSVIVKVDENTKMEFATTAIQAIIEKKNPPAVSEKSPGFFGSLKSKFGKKKDKKVKNKKASDSADLGLK